MRVALVEAGPLDPERFAGARADVDLLDGLSRVGHQPGLFTEAETEVMTKVRRFRPDVVVCSRPAVTLRHAGALQALEVPLVYFGHDLHYLRLAEQHRVEGGLAPSAARMMRAVEERCWEVADLSLYPDPAEADIVRAHLGEDRASYFPYYLFDMPSSDDRAPGPRPERADLFFVGGSTHGPNRDGITWFLNEVWPRLSLAEPGVRLFVCGSWHPQDRPAGDGPPGVEWTGPLAEDDMLALIRGCTATVAPLRYGAGVKRKVVQYLAGGIPTVTTPVGAQGLGITAGRTIGPPFVVAEGVTAWLDALHRVVTDVELRRRMSLAGRELVRRRYGTTTYLEAIASMLNRVGEVHAGRVGGRT